MIFCIWVSLQSSSPKCSCPARTTKRRILDICFLCLTTSLFVHIVLACHHICSASFERAKVSNFHLSMPRPKMTDSIVKHTPTFSCLLFLVYLSCHTTAYLPPLFYCKKITAPCGAAHFLRWSSQTLDIYVPVRVSTRIVSPSLTNSGTWSV